MLYGVVSSFRFVVYYCVVFIFASSALTLLVGRQEEHPACKVNSVMRCWRG